MTHAARVTVLLAVLVSLTAPAHGQIYVDKNASGANDGTSWTDAYTDLQTAIDNASGSSELWIAEGVYKPDSEGDSFTIIGNKDGIELYGGFEGTESSRSEREPTQHRTILSGDLNGDDADPDGDGIIEDASQIAGGENAHHVLLLDGRSSGNITAGTVIDGMVVTAGQADAGSFPDENGGGLFCDGRGPRGSKRCTPTLRRVVFAGNAASSNGGAIYNESTPTGTASPRITSATFTGNAATNGGAIYNSGGNDGTANPQLTNATFTDNAAANGGAIYNFGDNRGTASPRITNATFVGNAATDGGAIYNLARFGGVTDPEVTNTILWGNAASGDGDEMYNQHSGGEDIPVLAHTIIEGGVNGAGVAGDTNRDGGGNLDKDPQFADPSNPAGPDGTFATVDDGGNVLGGSPAIDAGDGTAVPAGVSSDIAGTPRVQDRDGDGAATVNIGAYETPFLGSPTAVTGSVSAVTGTSADLSGTVGPNGFETTVQVQVFPVGHPSEARTVTASNSPLPAGTVPENVTLPMTGLTPETEYKARIIASNNEGDARGAYAIFATGSTGPPVATTEAPSSVGATSVDFAGTVNPGGAETTAEFEFRRAGTSSFTIVEADESPLTGTTEQPVSRSGSLDPDTEYEVKVIASNSEGADEGRLKTFTTPKVGLALTGGGFGGLERTFSATPGQADQPVGVFRLTPAQSGVDLTAVAVTPDNPGLTGVDRAALWISDDNSFDASGDTELASLDLDPQTDLPSPMTFDGFTEALPGSARYLFVTVTLTSEASGAVTGFLGDETALSLNAGTITEVNGNSGQDQFSNLPLSGEASALPVEMASFEGTRVEDGVRLRWETASEQNNAGFRIERREASARGVRKGERANGREGAWTEVGFVEGAGTTSNAQTYRFTDADLPYAADTLAYRLRQVDTDGSTSLTDPVTVARSGPEGLELLGTAPNPARQRATVRFAVPDDAEAAGVTMRLYDVMGRQVRTVETSAEAGRHEQTLDVSGLSSGVYVLRLRAGGQAQTRKLTVVR